MEKIKSSYLMPVNQACIFQQIRPKDTTLISAPKGSLIFAYDQVASFIYHLHEGVVAGVRITKKGHQVTDVFVPNQFIGLMGFLDMYGSNIRTHVGEAKSITPVIYCKVRREAMWELMDDRQARAQIINMVCNQALSRGLLTSSPLKSDVSTRIIRVMRLLEQSVGKQVNGDITVIENISHGDIALISNTTRATVTRTIDKLEKAGILELSPKQIKIARGNSFLDPECISRIKELLQI
jgi:CRP/FNR family transcriptional regulator, cyclic AMP receptor protein